MKKQTLSEQMRETVNMLSEFKGDTPCRFDPESNMILFTVEDLEAFAVNWKFKVDRHDHLGMIAMCWDTMKDKLLMARVPKESVKPRSRLAPPHVFGILLVDPDIKDTVLSTLRIKAS